MDPVAARCRLVLPEWDAAAEVEELLSALPGPMRAIGATGSCVANLASPSAAGLGIHSCRATKVRNLSRPPLGIHPEVVAEGQEFRRREDGATFRIVEADPGSPTVVAWSGRRRVRLTRTRLLARRDDGGGRDYRYLGGGVGQARRRRQTRPER
ncbi:MAG TPA: hypothetical protein VHA80_01075 [Solirubrobacterales bacterium]|nr:hypothetical protein [Solirubrobacterales bacterium]